MSLVWRGLSAMEVFAAVNPGDLSFQGCDNSSSTISIGPCPMLHLQIFQVLLFANIYSKGLRLDHPRVSRYLTHGSCLSCVVSWVEPGMHVLLFSCLGSGANRLLSQVKDEYAL